MNRQDFKLFLLGLLATLLIGGGGMLLYFSVFDQPPQQTAASEPPPASTPEATTPSVPTPPPAEKPQPAIAEADPARREVESRIAAAPDIARFFDRLRLALPGEYEAAVQALVKRQAGGASDSADYALSEAVKSLRQSRGALAAKADAPALSKVFERQLAVLKALSVSDPKLCVDFLYGGASEAFFRFSADNRALVADLAIAGLDAILDGKEKNIQRATPSEQDFQMFETTLKQNGLDQTEIDALLDGKTPNPPLPDARMCQAGQTYLETLAIMPDDTKLRVYSLAIDLMARS